jgi:two-component system, cell cycle response regulator
MESRAFDIVCVSYRLDDMNGIMLCESLRENIGRRLPVIMVMSVEDGAFQVASMKSGITEVFNKGDISRLDRYLGILADLVLTDVILEGGMSGFELAREIRVCEGSRGRVPILALSGVEYVARKVELLRGGVNDYISKPVLKEELAARVGNLIENKKLMDRVATQQEHLEALAMTDQLTGLLNRRHMQDVFPGRASDARRHNMPLSLIVIDLDHFKWINDNHGHSVGDVVLVEVSASLKQNYRTGGFVVRFGGEEFVIVLPKCGSEDALTRPESFRAAIEASKPAGLDVTASVGVSELPLDRAVSFEALFHAADEALYEAKGGGRNQVRLGAVGNVDPVLASTSAESAAVSA